MSHVFFFWRLMVPSPRLHFFLSTRVPPPATVHPVLIPASRLLGGPPPQFVPADAGPPLCWVFSNLFFVLCVLCQSPPPRSFSPRPEAILHFPRCCFFFALSLLFSFRCLLKQFPFSLAGVSLFLIFVLIFFTSFLQSQHRNEFFPFPFGGPCVSTLFS